MDLSTYAVESGNYPGTSGRWISLQCPACGGLEVGNWDTTHEEHASLGALVEAATAHHHEKHTES